MLNRETDQLLYTLAILAQTQEFATLQDICLPSFDTAAAASRRLTALLTPENWKVGAGTKRKR